MSKDVREFIRPLEAAGLTVGSTAGVFVKVECLESSMAATPAPLHSVRMEALLL